jgi:hypothetical protein
MILENVIINLEKYFELEKESKLGNFKYYVISRAEFRNLKRKMK